MKQPEQLDMLKSPQDRARPWREAAETAKHDPHFTERERCQRADYYSKRADAIERGEA